MSSQRTSSRRDHGYRFYGIILRFDIACRAACTMEINPYLNRMKDLTERTESLRGYL